ncbi:MAG: hypothetical protein FJW77_11135 [Actinobacteria bacterium]|nr:hypothetical protein [Actinomycetota bacterium]
MGIHPRDQHPGAPAGPPSGEHAGDGADPAAADYPALVDEFRCHTTDWIHTERDRVVRHQRALRIRELALTRVLDERGAIDDTLAATDGISIRAARATVATARALEDLPTIAAAAAAGHLSDAQLTELVKVADPTDEHHWARQAPAWTPDDLAHHARTLRRPTLAEAAARRDARTLRWWWNRNTGMLDGRFSLPDIDGATFETVVGGLVERMRPARGQAWETHERRGADALLELCRAYAERDPDAPTSGARAHFVVQVPATGPATLAGIPLPAEMVERLRADARVEPVLPDSDGVLADAGTDAGAGANAGRSADAGADRREGVGRTRSVLGEKARRVVRQRDGHCRWPGCDRRHGLETHHLWPVSWGGTDHRWNLAAVCSTHHAQLAPQGRWLLLGNPNNPAGLTLVDRDDLPALAALAAERDRAGPGP